MRPIYIFDLDGTLALADHRVHHIQGESKDWPAFFAACVDDVPNRPIIRILRNLRSQGAEVWIWTGRSDEVREQTLRWLRAHASVSGLSRRWWPENPDRFRMRKVGDHRPDHELKDEWLSEVEPPEFKRITAAFEDRDRVVQMWRENGITCCQVAPGNF